MLYTERSLIMLVELVYTLEEYLRAICYILERQNYLVDVRETMNISNKDAVMNNQLFNTHGS